MIHIHPCPHVSKYITLVPVSAGTLEALAVWPCTHCRTETEGTPQLLCMFTNVLSGPCCSGLMNCILHLSRFAAFQNRPTTSLLNSVPPPVMLEWGFVSCLRSEYEKQDFCSEALLSPLVALRDMAFKAIGGRGSEMHQVWARLVKQSSFVISMTH